MSDTPLLLSSKLIRKWGSSYVVTLDKLVRKALGVKEGDRIVFRRWGKYVVVAFERASSVAPISEDERRQARAALGV